MMQLFSSDFRCLAKENDGYPPQQDRKHHGTPWPFFLTRFVDFGL